MARMDEYLWLVIVGFIFAFFYAFGIGANDVANAFGSTVASRSLTLKQAIIAASIFEFAGAYLLGAGVTNTIRNKIFDPDLYEGEEDIVLLGMFTSLITGTIMLNVATWFALPVSTTHTIVGCIMGFSIVAKGFDSIDWETGKKIFVSWLVSPP
jgi:phosphate/sulfate permease